VEAVRSIKKRLGDAIQFVSPDDEEADLLLVVTGCKTACVDIEPFGNRAILFVNSREGVDTFIDEVRRRQGGSKLDAMGRNILS
jgi:hypothetical protein